MLSLEKKLEELKNDIVSKPMRINAYHDLPFAIFRYDPSEEYPMRKHIRLLAITLEQYHNRAATCISLAKLMWSAIEMEDGIDKIAQLEKQRGFSVAEQTIHAYLEGESSSSLVNQLIQALEQLNPDRDIVFLVRTAALAPSIYRCSHLLDQLHGRTMVPIILFYPGTAEGPTDLRFMNIPEQSAHGGYNYRVKIYGGEE